MRFCTCEFESRLYKTSRRSVEHHIKIITFWNGSSANRESSKHETRFWKCRTCTFTNDLKHLLRHEAEQSPIFAHKIISSRGWTIHDLGSEWKITARALYATNPRSPLKSPHHIPKWKCIHAIAMFKTAYAKRIRNTMTMHNKWMAPYNIMGKTVYTHATYSNFCNLLLFDLPSGLDLIGDTTRKYAPPKRTIIAEDIAASLPGNTTYTRDGWTHGWYDTSHVY